MLSDRPLLRRLGLPLLSFAVVAGVGVVGFVALAGVGVVEAAFWLLDPTSIELHGAGQTVKAFALLLFAGLVLCGLWIGETVTVAAFGGQIGDHVRRMAMTREIDSLSGHTIVCGYGMLGRTVESRLRAREQPVVVIERDEAAYQRLVEDGVLALHADARRESVLTEAGIERARNLVAAVDDSNTNIQIAINASQLAPSVTVTVRVGDEMYEQLARRAGADEVVIPEVVSGEQVSDRLVAPGLDEAGDPA